MVRDVLVKQLQVFYGNCLFKYPEGKQQKHCKRGNKYTKGTLFITAGPAPPREITMNEKQSRTHSLSMEKQVTGPSAVQVAVLNTSLQEDQHCICQLCKT